jgi:hypothetical protein
MGMKINTTQDVNNFKEFIVTNFDEPMKSAFKLLWKSDPLIANDLTHILSNSKNPKVKDFLQSLQIEREMKQNRSSAIKSEIDNINKLNQAINKLTSNYHANPKDSINDFFQSILYYSGTHEKLYPNYNKVLEALVHNDPAKAYPIIRALAAYKIPPGEEAIVKAEQEKAITLCKELKNQCERYTLERLNQFEINYEIFLDDGKWQATFKGYEYNKELFNDINKLFNETGQTIPPTSSDNTVNHDISKINETRLILNEMHLASTLGVSEDQLTSLFFKQAFKANKDKIIESKQIIAKIIKDKTITDEELKTIFNENNIGLYDKYFYLDKNNPTDKLNLKNLMSASRPQLLAEMTKEAEASAKFLSKSDLAAIKEMEKELSQIVSDSHIKANNIKRSAAFSEVVNLKRALAEYRSQKNLSGTIKDYSNNAPVTISKIFQDVVADGSNIRKEIVNFKNSQNEEERNTGIVLERIVKFLETSSHKG